MKAENTRHITVYAEQGQFAAWPANNGIWSWDGGGEILVGFRRGTWKVPYRTGRHYIDEDAPKSFSQARSCDYGETWQFEDRMISDSSPDRIHFLHPEFAMQTRMTGKDGGISIGTVSYNRGKTWSGLFICPKMENRETMMRTDYIVMSDKSCVSFGTVSKRNGREGTPSVFITNDSGLRWVGELIHEDLEDGYSIMPSAILCDGYLLCAVRRRRSSNELASVFIYKAKITPLGYIAVWRMISSDIFKEKSAGNPPHLIKLNDGGLLMTSALRATGAVSIVGSVSRDGGETWCDPIIIRDGLESWDCGYTRTVQRKDGAIVTIYYQTRPDEKLTSIDATIWNLAE